jgi:hypothetical protein
MKKIIHENHQLVVTPDTRTDVGYGLYQANMRPGEPEYNGEMLNRLRCLKDQILRHVDGLALGSDNRIAPGAVQIKFDTREVCSFCDRDWEVELSQAMIDEEGLLFWTESPDTLHLDGPGLPMCCDAAQEEWRSGIPV